MGSVKLVRMVLYSDFYLNMSNLRIGESCMHSFDNLLPLLLNFDNRTFNKSHYTIKHQIDTMNVQTLVGAENGVKHIGIIIEAYI